MASIYDEAREAAVEMAADFGLDGVLHKPSYTRRPGGGVTGVTYAPHDIRYVPNGRTRAVDDAGNEREAARFLVFSEGLTVPVEPRDEVAMNQGRFVVASAVLDAAGATWDVVATHIGEQP